MAAKAGNASFITWLIVALLFLPIVLSTVQMSRYNPGSGGFFRYAKAGLNITAGYWSGMLYIAGYTFAVAVETLALRQIFLMRLARTGSGLRLIPFYSIWSSLRDLLASIY